MSGESTLPQSWNRHALWVGLTLAILLDTAAQLLWKSGVASVPDAETFWQTSLLLCQQPLLLGVGALMAGSHPRSSWGC